MDEATSSVKMAEQVERVKQSAMSRVYGWKLEIEDLTLFVNLSPRLHQEKGFLLKVSFGEFPHKAPSYTFVDRSSKQFTNEAWPPNVRHGNTTGICTPGTREFHEDYHKNEPQYSWDVNKYPLLDTLQRIQKLMEVGIDG